MLRQNIIRRLRYLRKWELINIFYLPLCLYIALKVREVEHWQPYALSMFVLCLVLAQAVFYWHLKLQTIGHNQVAFPPYFNRLFSFFKWADIGLLSIYPIFMLSSQITALIDFRVSLWSNALFLFAILEYINYYYYQLSHDNLNDIRFLLRYKKIRRSPLYVDLQDTQERSQRKNAS